jgi:hypothetical protein
VLDTIRNFFSSCIVPELLLTQVAPVSVEAISNPFSPTNQGDVELYEWISLILLTSDPKSMEVQLDPELVVL